MSGGAGYLSGGLNGFGQAYSQSNYSSAYSAYHSQLRAYAALAGTPRGAAATPIPREGIRAGEITAYRAWALTLDGGWLKAVSAGKIWLPFETMEGDVDQHGIYCFKHPAYVGDAFGEGYGPRVGGSIEIWGEVIEHEKGYRAQYARIVSLDVIYSFPEQTVGFWRKRKTNRAAAVLETLRYRYGVPSQQSLLTGDKP